MGARGIIRTGSALAVVAVALTASAQPDPAVDIQLFQYQPGAVEVKAGVAITWTNRDPEHPSGRFDARLAGRGATTTVVFREPGVYPYFCERHPSMRGEIRVKPS